MKRLSTLGPSVLLAVLAGISYFLITDIDTKEFTKNFTSLNMPYEMTQSFYKRTRFSDEKLNLNRPPFIKINVASDKDQKSMQLNIALCGEETKEKPVPYSTVMDLAPYVSPGNDPKLSLEYSYTTPLVSPPTVNLSEIQPLNQLSYNYGSDLESRLDEINDQYDSMLEDLSNQYEASLDNAQGNNAAYKKIRDQYKTQLSNLKTDRKKAIDEYKKLTKVQNNQKKDIRGCTFTVEVVKTNGKSTVSGNRNISTPSTTRSKAVSRDRSDSDSNEDDDAEDYPN